MCVCVWVGAYVKSASDEVEDVGVDAIRMEPLAPRCLPPSRLRQLTSAYVRIRGRVSGRRRRRRRRRRGSSRRGTSRCALPASISPLSLILFFISSSYALFIGQHTSQHVSISQHTSAYGARCLPASRHLIPLLMSQHAK